jgi:hypothetical protein
MSSNTKNARAISRFAATAIRLIEQQSRQDDGQGSGKKSFGDAWQV